MIRFITKVLHQRQLLVAHLRGNLFENLAARNLVRQRCNYDVTVFFFVRGTQPQRAIPLVIDLFDLAPR